MLALASVFKLVLALTLSIWPWSGLGRSALTLLTAAWKMTSSVTWPFDSRWVTSYGWSIVTMRLSCIVMEIWRLKSSTNARTDAQVILESVQCYALHWTDNKTTELCDKIATNHVFWWSSSKCYNKLQPTVCSAKDYYTPFTRSSKHRAIIKQAWWNHTPGSNIGLSLADSWSRLQPFDYNPPALLISMLITI